MYRADKSIVVCTSGVFILFYNILLTDALFIFAHCSFLLSLLYTFQYITKLKLFTLNYDGNYLKVILLRPLDSRRVERSRRTQDGLVSISLNGVRISIEF